MDSQSLAEIFLNNTFGECHKWSHYLEIYNKHLSTYRGKSPVILEIGVRSGGSLGLWRNYFGPKAIIIGVDIEQSCASLSKDGFEIYIGNQSDLTLLQRILDQHLSIDIVIDDGSHITADMIKTFEFLYPRINKEAIYIVEDIVPSIVESRDSGNPSFLEYASELLLQLNLGFGDESIIASINESLTDKIIESKQVISDVLHPSASKFPNPNQFTTSTKSLSFYPNMIVFEKSPQSMRSSIKSAGMSPNEFAMYNNYKLTNNG